ncbi:MAG: restriction endonuclease subunit S [Opitutaceae bacterium]|nr:restriction endonuclease subunit S [Opitutaceae bacterium]
MSATSPPAASAPSDSSAAADFLLTHFDRLAEAPGGIAKLRALLMQLAVQGKLLPQDPADGAASTLLMELRTARTRLMKAGKISREKFQEEVTEDEQLFSIPNTWIWCRLGDLGDWGSGSTPARSDSRFFGGTTLWLKSGELNDLLALDDSEEKITDFALQKCSLRLNQPGDVLIAMYGATIGKLAILAKEATTNQAVCGCTCFDGVYNRYLFHLLRSYRDYFIGRGEGGAQPNISKIKIISTPVPLPSLAEQRRIVAKVEALMGLCDALEAAQREREAVRTRLRTSALHQLTSPDSNSKSAAFIRQHLPSLIAEPKDLVDIRQSILQLAIGGRIVPQVANESRPALRQPDKAQEIDTEWPIGELPSSWVACPLGQLLRTITNGITVTPSKVLQRFAVTRIETIWNGTVDMSRVGFVDDLTDDQLERFRLKDGDILLSHINSEIHLGKTAIVQKPPANLIHGMNLLRLSFFPESVDPTFAHYQLTALRFARYFILRAQRAVNQSSLNQAKIKKTPFMLPPLAEQRRIVAKVDELMAVLDALEASLTTARTTAESLLAATIARLHAA